MGTRTKEQGSSKSGESCKTSEPEMMEGTEIRITIRGFQLSAWGVDLYKEELEERFRKVFQDLAEAYDITIKIDAEDKPIDVTKWRKEMKASLKKQVSRLKADLSELQLQRKELDVRP